MKHPIEQTRGATPSSLLQPFDRNVKPRTVDPIPGREGVSLEQALQALKGNEEDEDYDEALAQACSDILRMARGEPLFIPEAGFDPVKDGRVDPMLIDVLMRMGQTELLRHVVTTYPRPDDRLPAEIGLVQLEMLASIGAAWPLSEAHITLSGALPPGLIGQLLPFLNAVSSLSLTVVPEGVLSDADAFLFGSALLRCKGLHTLTLVVPASPAENLLRFLPGIRAESVVLNVTVDHNTPTASLRASLANVVWFSTSRKLDLVQCELATPLDAAPDRTSMRECQVFLSGLLSGRQHWDVVAVTAGGLEALPDFGVSIDRLEVHDDKLLNCTPSLMRKAFHLQVHTFHCRTLVDITQLEASVQDPVWVERFEAVFVMRETDRFHVVKNAIERNPAIVSIDLIPIDVIQKNRLRVVGYGFLLAQDGDTFRSMSRAKHSARLALTRPLSHPSKWSATVEAIRVLLDPDVNLWSLLMNVAHTVQTLKVTERSRLYSTEDRASTAFLPRLLCLLQCRELLPAVHAALIQLGASDPQRGKEIVRVLAQCMQPIALRTATEWQSFAVSFRRDGTAMRQVASDNPSGGLSPHFPLSTHEVGVSAPSNIHTVAFTIPPAPVASRNPMLDVALYLLGQGHQENAVVEVMWHRLWPLTQAIKPKSEGEGEVPLTPEQAPLRPEDERQIPWLLETLAYFGAIPADQWLQTGLGFRREPMQVVSATS